MSCMHIHHILAVWLSGNALVVINKLFYAMPG